MKKFRVMYRQSERANDPARTEEVYADGWKVDSDQVVLYQHEREADVSVFDVPKTRVLRIQELR
ncbi:MAG: hypothetical protein Q7T33_03340 [Dehalococcoidia bacterium]|nr:hypothetical protein [Dehalococcoidia bacterium]